MLRCREAARLVSKSMDVSLRLKERLPLGLHLSMCPRCSEYRRQLQALRTMIQEELDHLIHPEAGGADGLTPQERAALLQAVVQGAQ